MVARNALGPHKRILTLDVVQKWGWANLLGKEEENDGDDTEWRHGKPGWAMLGQYETTLHGAGAPAAERPAADIGSTRQIGRITAAQPPMSWAQLILHVLVVTVIANVGKLFPAFCYRKEAH